MKRQLPTEDLRNREKSNNARNYTEGMAYLCDGDAERVNITLRSLSASWGLIEEFRGLPSSAADPSHGRVRGRVDNL